MGLREYLFLKPLFTTMDCSHAQKLDESTIQRAKNSNKSMMEGSTLDND